jgi:hypothetical protein
MSRAPKVLRAWQFHNDSPAPTCYDARNPAAPWLPADELGYDDAQDRMDARDWFGGGHGSVALRDVQDPYSGGVVTACRRPPARPAPTAAPTSIRVLEQIAQALHAPQVKP